MSFKSCKLRGGGIHGTAGSAMITRQPIFTSPVSCHYILADWYIPLWVNSDNINFLGKHGQRYDGQQTFSGILIYQQTSSTNRKVQQEKIYIFTPERLEHLVIQPIFCLLLMQSTTLAQFGCFTLSEKLREMLEGMGRSEYVFLHFISNYTVLIVFLVT